MYIYYILVIISIYVIVQLVPIYIDFYALNHEDKRIFKLTIITLFGLIKIKLDMNRVKYIFYKITKLKQRINKIKKKLKHDQKQEKSFSLPVELIKSSLKQFINSIILHKLYLKFLIGLKDASITAIVMGAIYSIIGIVKPVTNNISISQNYQEDIYIRPFYNQYRFELEIYLRIQFRIAHLTLIMIKQLLKIIRRRINKWRIIPSRA